jgi:ribonuclease BN (tRNA processing enzyme)
LQQKKGTMEIKFVGSGGAFDIDYGNSAAILSHNDDHILIDCGGMIYERLRRKELVHRLTHVLLSHLHDDHCGSVSTLLLHRALAPGSVPLKLIYQDEGFRQELNSFLSHSLLQPEKYFSFVPISEFPYLEAIDTKNMHMQGMQTYAFIFSSESENIVFSGDLNNPDFLMKELAKRGIHGAKVFHDISFFDYPAHTYYKRLEPYLAEHILIGYHHDPRQKPADCRLELVTERPEYLF